MSGNRIAAWALVTFMSIMILIRSTMALIFGEVGTALMFLGAGIVIGAGILLTMGRDSK